MKYYAIVIDTDQYAGNFEYEMTNYCTGLETPRASEYFGDDVIQNAEWWDDNTYEYSESSDDFPEVCSIWPTPGRCNNGMGWHFDDTPENRILAVTKCRESLIQYHSSQKAMVERRLRENDFEPDTGGRGWTKEACERTLKSIESHIETAGQFVGSPAYQSVAIFSGIRPPLEVVEEVKQRAMAFNAVYQENESGRPENVTVERIRVIEINKATTVTEIEIEV